MLTKTFSFLLLAALAAAHVPDPDHAAPLLKNRKIQVGAPMDLAVSQSAIVAVPLALVAEDYKGPYDPMDPDGVAAATHRRSKMEGRAALEAVKSYIPPGTVEVLRKEIVKLVLNEGRRFAFAHPREAAELVSIFHKAVALYGTTTHKLKDLEKKKGSAKKF